MSSALHQQVAPAVRAAMRLPYAAAYRAAVSLRAPLRTQVRLLPMPDPLPLRWIDPANIPLWSNSRRWTSPRSARFCYGGDWDLRQVHPRKSIFEPETAAQRYDVHETIRAIFLQQRPYETTPQYERMMQLLAERPGANTWGCRSAQEVDAYFQRMMQAFESMRTRGYRTQRELGNRRNPLDEEMRLYVTRDGRLCQGSGANHRIRMAEILGIRWVPFVLRGAHPQWVMKLSRELGLPPHEAVAAWIETNELFRASRPDRPSTAWQTDSVVQRVALSSRVDDVL